MNWFVEVLLAFGAYMLFGVLFLALIALWVWWEDRQDRGRLAGKRVRLKTDASFGGLDIRTPPPSPFPLPFNMDRHEP